MTIVLDTHTLIWFLSDDQRLGVKAREVLLRRDGIDVIIPIIVLFEIAYLQKRKNLPVSMTEIKQWISCSGNMRVYPVDMSILDVCPKELEIHDAMIVGTALALGLSGPADVWIVSCDQEITNCKGVQTIW